MMKHLAATLMFAALALGSATADAACSQSNLNGNWTINANANNGSSYSCSLAISSYGITSSGSCTGSGGSQSSIYGVFALSSSCNVTAYFVATGGSLFNYTTHYLTGKMDKTKKRFTGKDTSLYGTTYTYTATK